MGSLDRGSHAGRPDNVCADWCHESSLNRFVARVFRHVPQGSLIGTAEAGDEGPLILRQRVAGTNPPSTA
jgi:hypothetical protein